MQTIQEPRLETVETVEPRRSRRVFADQKPRRPLVSLSLVFLVLFGLLVLAGIIGTGWVLNSYAGVRGSADTPPLDMPASVGAFGHVDVEDRIVELYPVLPNGLPNTVSEVLVKENDFVKKGGVLLRMDGHHARYAVQRAEADLRAAQIKMEQSRDLPAQHDKLIEQQLAALAEAKRTKETAELTHQQAKRKFDQRLISQEDLDIAQKQIDKAAEGIRVQEAKLVGLQLQKPLLQRDIERAREDVAAKQAQLDQAKYAQEQCELKAPVDGTVLRLAVTVGQLLGPQPREPAIFFCPATPRIVRAEVVQEWANRIKVGQPAIIRDDATLTSEWRGKVKQISDWYTHRRSLLLEPRQMNDVRTLECIIELDPEQSKDLRIGQRVRVKIEKQ